MKLYFPKAKYIDKVVIIEIKQTYHTVWLHYEDISICFYLFVLKTFYGFRHCLDWRNGALEMVCRDNHLHICTLWRPPLKTRIQPLPDPDIKQKNPRGHEYQTTRKLTFEIS